MNLKLTREERARIFRGDYRPLVRDKDPEIKGGEKLTLSARRGGPQFVNRDEDTREQAGQDGQAVTINVPAEPTVWIELKPAKRRIKGGSTEWLIAFTAHDTRQEARMLGAAPSGSSSSGLRTRWKQSVDEEGNPKPKPKQKESFTPESERGYASGGRVVDHLSAVDDSELERQGAEARARFSDFRQGLTDEEEDRRRQEREFRDRFRLTMKELSPDGQVSLLAGMQRLFAEHQEAGEEKAA